LRGDRSAKSRTHDFPEGIAIDHRNGRGAPLARILAGELDLLSS
jgi:protein subunit release factor A